MPDELREPLENLSDEDRAELEEAFQGSGNLQQWLNSPIAKVLLVGAGAAALKFFWDWFHGEEAPQQPVAQPVRPAQQRVQPVPPVAPIGVRPAGAPQFGGQQTEAELAGARARLRPAQPGEPAVQRRVAPVPQPVAPRPAQPAAQQMVVAPVGPNVPQAPPLQQPGMVVAPVGPNVPQAPPL